MATSFLRLAVFLCLAYIACAQEIILNMYPATADQWYQVDSDVNLKCEWEHNSADRVQVIWRNGDNTRIRKITEGDPNNTYVYQTSVPEEERQQEFHDFAENVPDEENKVQLSELTIINITLSDPRAYYCAIELGTGLKDDNMKFDINLFELPTVTVMDKVVSVDIRAPIETPTTAAPEVESNNATEPELDYTDSNETIGDDSDSSDDDTYDGTDYYEDGDDEDESDSYVNDEAAEVSEQQQIEVECQIEGAYPKPKIIFRVGEGDPIEAEEVVWTSGSDDTPYSGIAVLKLDPDPMYNGKSVSCSAVLPTKPEPRTIFSDTSSSLIEILHDVTEVKTTLINGVSISGEEVQIICESNGNPKPTFSVQSDVSEKPQFEESADGQTFTIPSVLKGDAGTYWCVASLPSRSGDDSESQTMESDNRKTLKVHYIEDPTLSENQDIVLKLGDSREVSCTGNGNPQSTPMWKKNGQKIDSDSSLLIDYAIYKDEGTYTCETTNEAGTTSKTIKIRVQGGCTASFKHTVISGSTTTADRHYVKLECEVTGQPACTVNIVPQSGFTIAGERKEDGRVLEFEALPELSAPVSFFCIAYNDVGKANASTTIGEDTNACCAVPQTAGLSAGAIIGILLLVLVVVIGIPVAFYFVKKRNAQPKEKTPDAEEGEAEKEGLNKEASSERTEEP